LVYVLTKVRPKREEGTASWRRLHDEELLNFYAPLNTRIIRMTNSRRMKREGHVARMGVTRNIYTIFFGKPEGKNHSEDLGVDTRTILE